MLGLPTHIKFRFLLLVREVEGMGENIHWIWLDSNPRSRAKGDKNKILQSKKATDLKMYVCKPKLMARIQWHNAQPNSVSNVPIT
jgi:hypothetical protein